MTDYTREALVHKLGYKAEEISDADCNCVRRLCQRVIGRSSCLVAAGLATLVKRAYKDDMTKRIVIGADGSLFSNHPTFIHRVVTMMHALLGTEPDLQISVVRNASGLGAAIVAACHSAIFTSKL